MKKRKPLFQNISSVEKISQTFNELLLGIKSDTINSFDKCILLFFLIFKKYRLTDSLDSIHPYLIKKQIVSYIDQLRLQTSHRDQFKKLFIDIISRIDAHYVVDIYLKFNHIKQSTIDKNINSIFDDLLSKILIQQSKHGSEFFQPIELSDIVNSIINKNKKNASVYPDQFNKI